MLAANWRGGSTVPSRRQYPHQWGWDAAYIAIGWSWVDPARAAAELESLLRGQWPDGRVPHIVFHPDVPEDAYFPGPAFWDSDVGGVATSGLTQPPLHARAALEVARRSGDGDGVPAARLRARWPTSTPTSPGAATWAAAGWRRSSTRGSPGSTTRPAWDEPLAAVELPAEGVEPYERQDRRHVDAAERPDDAAYDRFVHLARAYRDSGYADDGRSAVPGRGPAVQRDLAVVHARAGRDRRADRRGPGAAPRGGGAHPRRAARAALGRRALPRRAICAPTG